VKKAVNPKSSGGGGYVFENQVAAYFFSCLLSDVPPLDASLGTIRRIDFQTADRKWSLDDILLTLCLRGEERHCAFFVRSGLQVTTQRVSPDFVAAIWRQCVPREGNPFKSDSDRLGLITSTMSRSAKSALDSLIALARAKNAGDLSQHVMQPGCVSDSVRALLTSLACPKDIVLEYGETQKELGDLLKFVEVLEYDFESSPSKQEQQAIGNCRAALQSGDLAEAQSLWSELQTFADQMRPLGGAVELTNLLDRLGRRFHLKAYPHLTPDWLRLAQQTGDCLTQIHDKIGAGLAIPRDQLVLSVDDALAGSRCCVLIGPSGHGKTVVAKQWALRSSQKTRVLWWNARAFEQPSFPAFESTLQLSHPLRDIMASSPDPAAVVVIDGIDRVPDSALDNVAILICSLRLDAGNGPWRLLMTCQPEEWGRVQTHFLKAGAEFPGWTRVEVDVLSTAETRLVVKAYPGLSSLLLQHHLQQLLRRPKILDLLARGVESRSIPDTRRWVGESDLVSWFWNSEVQKEPKGQQRALFLQLLAERTADLGQSSVPRSDLSVSELEPLQGLIQDRICVEAEERIGFIHGLYADWARQRFLIGHESTLKNTVAPRLALPSWQRAVRLYGLHLLEQKGVAAWQEAFAALAGGQDGLPLGQDLMLEAAIFASDPAKLLESLWPVLSSDDGQFLRRLLDRFLYVATLPNPAMVGLVKELGEESRIQLSLLNRIPYWPYWLPVIRFLVRHSSDVLKLCRRQVAQIADLWLRVGPTEWPLRKEVAGLALAMAEELLDWKRGPGIRVVVDREVEPICYRAALAGVTELPDRVGQFARDASGRVVKVHCDDAETETGPPAANANDPDDTLGIPQGPIPPPWPDGPRHEPDRSFREDCLTGDAAFPLILANPSIAREVILALLIEVPKRPHYMSSLPIEEDLSIEGIPEWHPALYHTGPFLFFLRNRPDEGLELILRIVDFATERWSSNQEQASEQPSDLLLRFSKGIRKFKGDHRVYNWYREGPYANPAGIALMALEKWLYDRIDAGESITQTLQKILSRTRSAAFLGVLSAVGRREPSLLSGPLKPLLSAYEIHEWELGDSIGSLDCFAIAWYQRSERERKLAQEWSALPHRKHGLHDVAQFLFLNVPAVERFFKTVIRDWGRQVEALPKGDLRVEQLKLLMARFDKQNYQIKHVAEKGDYWEFNLPESLKENEANGAAAGERLMAFALQSQCRTMLDQGEPLPQDQLENFWARIESISRIDCKRDSCDAAFDPYAAICGGMAVLVRFHRDWLTANPARDEWCAERVIEALAEPVASEGFDISRSTFDLNRESFLADLLPLLWAEDVEDSGLRQCVAQFAFSFHYKTVAILCRSASRVRQVLGCDFPRMLHLVLRWAVVRLELEIARNHGVRSLPQQQAEVAGWIKGEIAAFVKGDLSDRLPAWGELLEGENAPRAQDATVRAIMSHMPSPALDMELVLASLSWMPGLDAALDDRERAQWIGLWQEALHCALKHARRSDNLPYDSDRHILKRVASLVAEMRADEHSERLWKPVLDLGTKGHYWVEDFLRSWFEGNRQNGGVRSGFTRMWRDVIDYARTSPAWNPGDYHVEENWRALMGLDWLLINFDYWNAEKRNVVAAMAEAFEQWAEDRLHLSSNAVCFTAFLKQPAAEPLVLAGLPWLTSAAEKCGDDFWAQDRMPERLVALLDTCARMHMRDINQEPGSLSAFRFLLKGLVERRVPSAMALQESLTQ
jgi:hypothetical protein